MAPDDQQPTLERRARTTVRHENLRESAGLRQATPPSGGSLVLKQARCYPRPDRVQLVPHQAVMQAAIRLNAETQAKLGRMLSSAVNVVARDARPRHPCSLLWWDQHRPFVILPDGNREGPGCEAPDAEPAPGKNRGRLGDPPREHLSTPRRARALSVAEGGAGTPGVVDSASRHG